MNLVDGGILLGVSGYYTCTNISLPTADAQSQASAESPQDSEVPQESPQDGDDAQQLDAASAPAFEPIQNPQLQSFYASVFFDGRKLVRCRIRFQMPPRLAGAAFFVTG